MEAKENGIGNRGNSMCGRYYVDFESSKELQKILKSLNEKYPGRRPQSGDVYPTSQCAVWMDHNSEIAPELSIWGFPKTDHSNIMINARSETVGEKVMFRNSFQYRRCVIITQGFYEWNQAKQKFFFTNKQNHLTCLAGIYDLFEDGSHFVILTTRANDSMDPIHHRMPVVLDESHISSWIQDPTYAQNILSEIPPQLGRVCREEYEQLSLFT